MITREIYEAYVRHLLNGDRAACAELVRGLVAARMEVKQVYTELFERALYEVGGLWECNQISVATEHLATAITESLMNLVRPALLVSARTGRRAVIACSANEFHQIGGKMVADVFEMNGWDGYFLGANTPTEALLGFIGEKRPEMAGLSLSLSSNLPALTELIDRLRVTYPEVDILVGGQAFRNGRDALLKGRSGVRYVPSLPELETLIASQ